MRALLREGALLLQVRPFVVRLHSDVDSLALELSRLYADFQILPPTEFADFHVAVTREPGLRRWIKPLVRFFFDGQPSFIPLPAHQALAMLEWGLNWCVAAHCHQYLVIHAAVVEKNGRVAVLPAPPGSGKSTLCAGLVLRGWRLLSDELALYDMETGQIQGMARPVNLKNASIDVIEHWEPTVVMSTRVPDTTKGTVALMRPPAGSVALAGQPVRADWIILPRYEREAAPRLEARSRTETFRLLAEQSFNYDLLGRRGFEAVGRLVGGCACYSFTYSRLDDAMQVFEELAGEAAA